MSRALYYKVSTLTPGPLPNKGISHDVIPDIKRIQTNPVTSRQLVHNGIVAQL